MAKGATKSKPLAKFDAKLFLAEAGRGRERIRYQKNRVVFSQGDPADAIFYVHEGKVKLTVVSKQGKKAVIGVLGPATSSGRDAWLVRFCAWPRRPPCRFARSCGLKKPVSLVYFTTSPLFLT